LIVGSNAKKSIQSSGGRKTGEGLVTAANVIAWINLALCALGLVFFTVALLVGASNSNS
jgi:hypothetical protein